MEVIWMFVVVTRSCCAIALAVFLLAPVSRSGHLLQLPTWVTQIQNELAIRAYIQNYTIGMLRASMITYCCAAVSVVSLVGSPSLAWLCGCVF